jgi:KDO2-lipid IV(A) lauroyltransferase
VLESGGKMAFLADQYAGSRGCWVDFFGRPASAHKAIALFSLSHDAPLAVAGATRLGRPLHYELWTLAIADPCEDEPHVAGVPQLTQWYTRHLESTIRQTPDQYWWLHRRWKDNRATKKKACAA